MSHNDTAEETGEGRNVGRIQILPPMEARRIAAGEVVDRPAALVREFIDNAIDAGAANIDVLIEGGGSKKIEVVDDGEGMGLRDLELCIITHATSKIRSLGDLDISRTLGFRGEALAAAAAVSRLEIITSTDGREAWRLESNPGAAAGAPAGGRPLIERSRRTRGTTVRSHNLFDAIPARKRFLKRDSSEAALCRQVFTDKALAFPQIKFSLMQDGALKFFFPAVASKKERFAAAFFETEEKKFLHEINVLDDGFSAQIIIGGPELQRGDKRLLHVFANGRRVQDYALIQAMEYGVAHWFPNGTHPVGALYIEIDPALADFNIHPAKREVRFRDAGSIHNAVSSHVRRFFHHISLQRTGTSLMPGDQGETDYDVLQKSFSDSFLPIGSSGESRNWEPAGYNPAGYNPAGYSPAGFSPAGLSPQSLAMEALNENPPGESSVPAGQAQAGPASASVPQAGGAGARYIGRAFGIFLLIERGERLFIVDQHAAHERLLYDRFLSRPIPKQELLAPIPFACESEDEDRFLEAKLVELARLGVEIEKDAAGGWLIQALPVGWQQSDSQTVKEILNLKAAKENMAERWAATLCCHKSIKDGGYLDESAALELALAAFASEPTCPHGRPVWTEISRQALFKAVRREL
ncbi:MAG: DNA mismatch repair endonuclease MutL [Spirochaetes bacterium]|nr:DNA mismatch repair endonuclease MutL [Spirochaetota bacterium]